MFRKVTCSQTTSATDLWAFCLWRAVFPAAGRVKTRSHPITTAEFRQHTLIRTCNPTLQAILRLVTLAISGRPFHKDLTL